MKDIKILQDVLKVESKRYVSFGDFSVTDLINPVRLTALRKRYNNKIPDDIISSISSLTGVGLHELFENRLKIAAVSDPKYVLERTVQDIIQINNEPLLVTGRFDILYDMKHITDIKTCSTWKRIFDPELKDWVLQQNMYAYLLHTRGINVETLNLLIFYKDWLSASTRDPGYPQEQVEEKQIPLWDFNHTKEILYDLLTKHASAKSMRDDDLPECPAEERWERFPGGGTVQYAIMTSTKANRATKVFKDEPFNEVVNYILDRQAGKIEKTKPLPKGSFVEVRHAQRKRCETYCKFRVVCNHYQEYITKKNSNSLNEYIPIEVIL